MELWKLYCNYKLFCTVAFIVNIRIFKSNLVDLAYKSFEYLAVHPVVLIWMLVLLERYHVCFDSETHLSLTMIGKTSVTCWPLMSISVSMSWNTVQLCEIFFLHGTQLPASMHMSLWELPLWSMGWLCLVISLARSDSYSIPLRQINSYNAFFMNMWWSESFQFLNRFMLSSWYHLW